jgi:4-amino-4-deoxy-L-arabinose transferase-like glycosyltransferase
MLLHFGSIWLLASVLHRAGIKELALISFGFLLLLPPYVEPAAYVLSENLAEAMLVLAFVTLILWIHKKKNIWIALSSLAVAYAGLTRPSYQGLALGMAAALIVLKYLLSRVPLRWTEVMKASGILVFTSVLMLGSYAFINYQRFGYFGVTPRLGLTLNTKTWRFIERLPDEYAAIKAILIKARNAQLVQDHTEHDGSMSVWSAVPELSIITGLEYHKLSSQMLKLNVLLIKSAPLMYFREVVSAFGSYWFPSSTILANFQSRTVQLLWAVLHFFLVAVFAVTLVVLVGIAIFFQSCGKRGTRAGWQLKSGLELIHAKALMFALAGTIVIYTAAISCLVEVGNPRYRIPTDGLIFFMILTGIDLWRCLIDFATTSFACREDL